MEIIAEKIVTIEDAFTVEGSGVGITPFIPFAHHLNKSGPTAVLLRKPDGSELRVKALFLMPLVPHMDRLSFGCLITDLRKEDIPIGSEIYRLVESDQMA